MTISFFGEPQLKDRLLVRLEGHRAADEIIQGTYWENGKGCHIGCVTHSNDPMEFERQFGLSPYVARLGEYFFERFPNERAKDVPIEIISAIPVGVDSSRCWPLFCHWLLTDPAYGLLALPLEPHLVAIIQQVDALYATWPQIDAALTEAAGAAARTAARTAEAAARAAAEAAEAAAEALTEAAWAAVRAARAAGAAGAAARAAEAAIAGAAKAAWDDILDQQYSTFLSILSRLDVGTQDNPLACAPEQRTEIFIQSPV